MDGEKGSDGVGKKVENASQVQSKRTVPKTMDAKRAEEMRKIRVVIEGLEDTTIHALEPRKLDIGQQSSTMVASISSTLPAGSMGEQPSGRPYIPVASASMASQWRLAYPYYEGPNPPLGYTYYNGRWHALGLPMPLYAITGASKDFLQRRQRFWFRVLAVLTAQMVVISIAVGLYQWTTRESEKWRIQSGYPGVFVTAACMIVATVFCTLYCSIWRRQMHVQKIVTGLYFILELFFGIAVATAFERDYERPEVQMVSVTSFDACIGLTHCTLSVGFMLLCSLQKTIELASWTGFVIVMAAHFAFDLWVLLIYWLYDENRLSASIKICLFVAMAAAWIHSDIRRMMCDKRCAVTEHEYLFAVFQLQVDTFYSSWFMWELTRRGVRSLIGLPCARPRRRSLPRRDFGGPKKETARASTHSPHAALTLASVMQQE